MQTLHNLIYSSSSLTLNSINNSSYFAEDFMQKSKSKHFLLRSSLLSDKIELKVVNKKGNNEKNKRTKFLLIRYRSGIIKNIYG